MSFCTCGTCGRWFGSFQSRQQHLDAVDHLIPEFECDTCERFFRTKQSVEQHMNDTGHRLSLYECRCCYDTFRDEKDREDHEAEHHNYCADCGRYFQNTNNVRMHLNSRIHRGTTIDCPFCKANYATAAGLCHHLENGGCPSTPTLNRDRVYELVRSRDPCGVISKKLIDWYGSPSYEANSNTWNGSGYECYLCHRDFLSLTGLNQHLKSPIHQTALYHCPNRTRCGKEFNSLASVMNHLESESCGYTRFHTVQRKVGNMISGNRLITFD